MDEETKTGGEASIGKALLFMSMAAFASVATMRVADPLIPQIAHDFNVTAGEAAIVSSAFTIAYAVGQFVHGPLGDRFGKLRIIAWMTITSALTVSAAGLASSLASLGLVRFLAGTTAAAIVPLAMAFIGDHVAYENRQAVLARFLMGTTLGGVVGQSLGGLIGDWFGWRAVFPLLGFILLMMGLALLFEAKHGRLPPPKLSKTLSLTSITAGYKSLMRNPWARVILVIVFIEAFFFYGAFTFIGADLHQRFNISYSHVGFILCFFGIAGLTYASTVRLLIRRLGEHGLAMAGGILLASGFSAIIILPLTLIPIGMFVMGLGLYMVHNTLQTNATQMAPESRGLAVSTFANILFLGQAAGIVAGGLVVDHAGFFTIYIIAASSLGLLSIGFSHLLRLRR